MAHHFATETEVIVVGAGPTGLVAANLLGVYGVRTLLIERSPGLSQIPKALMVDDEFFRLLETLGLASQVRPNSVGPVGYEHYSPFGPRIARVEGRITEQGYPTRSAIFQPQFEKILLDGIARFDFVRVLFGHELVSFYEHEERVAATLRLPDLTTQAVSAAYVLAADGSHSFVRKALGISFDELVPVGLRHLVVDVADDPNESCVAVTRLGWRRNAASLPSPHRGRRYEFSLQSGEDEQALLQQPELDRLFRSFGFPAPQNIIRKTAYTFHARLAAHMQSRRVFLLGDAAHVMPVFGSQGMNSGARDANNIVWKIAAVLQGKARPDLLATYDEERRPQVAETIRAATAAGRWQNVGALPTHVLRHIAYLAISLLPPVRRYFANLRYIPKPSIRRGFLFPSPDPAAAALVGQILPNPMVEDNRGERLLDEVLGNGFSLLGLNVGSANTALHHGAWRSLDARRVLVSKQNHEPAPDFDIMRVKDTRSHPVFEQLSGHWLLIRPDRIVAAVVADRDVARLGDEVLHRLGASPRPVAEAAE